MQAAPDTASHLLPLDSDIEVTATPTPSRPFHVRGRFILLVAIGGAVGTAVRSLLSGAIPDVAGFPVSILVINVAGAFLLGLLLEGLAGSGPDQGLRRDARLMVGTGFMGGFTTYGTLATGTALLVLQGSVLLGTVYAGASLLLGAFATGAGIFAGTFLHVRRSRLGQDGPR